MIYTIQNEPHTALIFCSHMCWGVCHQGRVMSAYAGWYFRVYVIVHLLKREPSTCLTPTAGENHLY